MPRHRLRTPPAACYAPEQAWRRGFPGQRSFLHPFDLDHRTIPPQLSPPQHLVRDHHVALVADIPVDCPVAAGAGIDYLWRNDRTAVAWQLDIGLAGMGEDSAR